MGLVEAAERQRKEALLAGRELADEKFEVTADERSMIRYTPLTAAGSLRSGTTGFSGSVTDFPPDAWRRGTLPISRHTGFILVSCPVNSGGKAFKFAQDGVCRGGPHEGLAGFVVLGDEVIDLGDEVADAGKGAAANCLVGEQCEEALDLVEPGAVGRDEMEMPVRPARQPGFHARMLVRAVVVHDEMNIHACRDLGLDPAQEGQELLMPVTRLAVGEYVAAEDIEGRKERSRAMALVVVRDSLGITQPQRKHRLGALQGLGLALLIDTQHQGVLGRVQVKAHDITQLLDEERVGGKLEALGAMGLEAKQLQVAVHAGLGDAALPGNATYASVRRAVLGL